MTREVEEINMEAKLRQLFLEEGMINVSVTPRAQVRWEWRIDE